MDKPRVAVFAGLDPAGQAGIHQDQRVLALFNVEPDNRLQSAALKIGAVQSSQERQRVSEFLSHYSGYSVLDPVFQTTKGESLIDISSEDYRAELLTWIPKISLITPNIPEAEWLLHRKIRTHEEMELAARALLSLGANSVLLKGGHFHESLFSQDFWTNGKESWWITQTRYPSRNYRGTGCALSSAIAAAVASGYRVKNALIIASMILHQGIRLSTPIDDHTSKLFLDAWPNTQIDLPYLSPVPLQSAPPAFPPCELGFYPVVDSVEWVERLVKAGVRSIQLRIKDQSGMTLENSIGDAIAIAREHQALLFINDYWELALKYQAPGIHLGQEDLESADIDAIRRANFFLGVSTHCYYEVARAHTLRPSYLACGPIFPTTSKIMEFSAQGTAALVHWSALLDYPLVAIGGITLDNVSEILKTGAKGFSVISAVTKSQNPEQVSHEFLTHCR